MGKEAGWGAWIARKPHTTEDTTPGLLDLIGCRDIESAILDKCGVLCLMRLAATSKSTRTIINQYNHVPNASSPCDVVASIMNITRFGQRTRENGQLKTIQPTNPVHLQRSTVETQTAHGARRSHPSQIYGVPWSLTNRRTSSINGVESGLTTQAS